MGLLLATAGCLTGDDPEALETGELVQYAANNDKCQGHICGLNSPNLDDGWFYELNLDGEANRSGYQLVSASKNGAYYRLSVIGGRMIARRTSGSVLTPATLEGSLLQGLQIVVRKYFFGALRTYRLEIGGFSDIADYRATLPGGGTPPTLETYKFIIHYTDIFTGLPRQTEMCENGDRFVNLNGQTRMFEHHAVLFEGERIDVDTMTIADDTSRWINFGCAETALAKLHLAGHTEASRFDGFATNRVQRQTMLKMIVGDYCGSGRPFTVAGQCLEWADREGTVRITPGVTTQIEAVWDENGAVCLNTPRVEAHPSAASAEAFPRGVRAAITATCGALPPPCAGVSGTFHLKSYNVTPFTN